MSTASRTAWVMTEPSSWRRWPRKNDTRRALPRTCSRRTSLSPTWRKTDRTPALAADLAQLGQGAGPRRQQGAGPPDVAGDDAGHHLEQR